MPAGHLVAHGDLPFLGDVDFRQLDHTGRKLVRLEDLVDVFFGLPLHALDTVLGLVHHPADFRVRFCALHLQRAEVELRKVQIGDQILSELRAFLEEGVHRPFLQGQGHRIEVQNLSQLLVSGCRDAVDFVALQLPEFSDAGTVFLFE